MSALRSRTRRIAKTSRYAGTLQAVARTYSLDFQLLEPLHSQRAEIIGTRSWVVCVPAAGATAPKTCTSTCSSYAEPPILSRTCYSWHRTRVQESIPIQLSPAYTLNSSYYIHSPLRPELGKNRAKPRLFVPI